MKRVLINFLCIVLALIIFSDQAIAFSTIATALSEEEVSVVANFDETEIYSSFTEIDQFVSYIEENKEVTFDDMETNCSELVSNISSSTAIAFHDDEYDRTPPIFSAFIWGCLLNGLGMLIVGLTTDFDGDQITKSLWGCLLSSCLWGGSFGWSYYYGYW